MGPISFWEGAEAAPPMVVKGTVGSDTVNG